MLLCQTQAELLDNLNGICLETLKEKPRMVVAISGLCGSGKSTLGKSIRKQGFGDFKPYQIAVIDDNVMSLNLFLARPKIRYNAPPPKQKDNLKPFMKFLPPYVRIVFYISANLQRIDFTDVLIILRINDETRLKQLQKRENGNRERITALMSGSLNVEIPFTHALSLNL